MTVNQRTIDAAIEAVEAAAGLTTAAQRRLLAGDTLTKTDDSPVTIADFGAQAVVCAVLTEALGDRCRRPGGRSVGAARRCRHVGLDRDGS